MQHIGNELAMYIRIQNQAIRYRISQLEAEQLLSGETVFDCLKISTSNELTYSITISNGNHKFDYRADSNHFFLIVNKNSLLKELDQRPSKQGILIQNGNQALSIPEILLEIDLKSKNKVQQ
jgi:hypothetical protein